MKTIFEQKFGIIENPNNIINKIKAQFDKKMYSFKFDQFSLSHYITIVDVNGKTIQKVIDELLEMEKK